MTEAFRDYSSLGLIVPESEQERDRILAYIRKEKSMNELWERYCNPERLGYASIQVVETDNLFIQFRSLNTGVYKPSEITESIKNTVTLEYENLSEFEKVLKDTIILAETPGMRINWDIALKTIPALETALKKVPALQNIKRMSLKEALSRTLELKQDFEKVRNIKTLEEVLKKEGFKFRLIEAVSKWEDRNEEWLMITDTRSVTIDIHEIEKNITSAGYLALPEIMEYYELNYLVEIQDEVEVPVEEMTMEQKIKAILDHDAFNDSTGYYEWTEEEITLAVFKILKEEALKN